MACDNPNPLAAIQPVDAPGALLVSAVVPARNEELVIAACVESLARQPPIAQILVVNDQSSDRTADIVRESMKEIPNLRLIDAGRSEEHTSELQSHSDLVCRLLLEKKKNQ